MVQLADGTYEQTFDDRCCATHRNSTDIAPLYKEVEALQPDGVILWAVSKTTASFTNMASEEKLKAVLVGSLRVTKRASLIISKVRQTLNFISLTAFPLWP